MKKAPPLLVKVITFWKRRTTPGEPETFANNQKYKVTGSKNHSNIQEEHGMEHSLSSILGALMWI
eukprot:7733932-Prorocentrum_lima.AAC.1